VNPPSTENATCIVSASFSIGVHPIFTKSIFALLEKVFTPAIVSFPVFDTFPAIAFVIVVAKSGSSPRAAASSLSVSRAPGEESTRAAIAA
jgi:hypothetical protein